jgi:hypothetical protein
MPALPAGSGDGSTADAMRSSLRYIAMVAPSGPSTQSRRRRSPPSAPSPRTVVPALDSARTCPEPLKRRICQYPSASNSAA